MTIAGSPRRARAALAAVVVVMTACAWLGPSAPIRDVRELAGTWRGRSTGPAGHGVSSLVIGEDGAYRGTMYLDGEDRDFGGRIVVLPNGVARYSGSEGHGSVTLVGERDGRTLRFVHDGGGA
jgi:hypothetical protein